MLTTEAVWKIYNAGMEKTEEREQIEGNLQTRIFWDRTREPERTEDTGKNDSFLSDVPIASC